MRFERASLTTAGVLLALLLSACTAPADKADGTSGPVSGGEGPPREWALESGQAMSLDRAQSRVDIRVYRGGRLAHLGHNHVFEVLDLRGSVKHLVGGGGSVDLVFRPDRLGVDNPAARSRAGDGFADQPDPGAIAGTRSNMLGIKLLDASNWPEVRVLARVGALGATEPMAEVFVRLRGISRRYETPVQVETRAGEIRVSGTLAVRQSDFGITPYAVFGGALQVRDEIQADFLVVGRNSGGAM